MHRCAAGRLHPLGPPGRAGPTPLDTAGSGAVSSRRPRLCPANWVSAPPVRRDTGTRPLYVRRPPIVGLLRMARNPGVIFGAVPYELLVSEYNKPSGGRCGPFGLR